MANDSGGMSTGAKALIGGCLVSLLLGLGLLAAAVVYVTGVVDTTHSIGEVFRQDSTTLDTPGSMADVVAAMEAIDLAKCPEDVAAAYRAHIAAWQQMADIEADVPTYDAAYGTENGFRLAAEVGDPMTFEKLDLTDAERAALIARYNQALSDIDTTFAEVIAAANEHGVNYYNY